MTEKRIGFSRLHMTDGRILHNHIVVFAEGRVVRHYPITDEEPFTSWVGGDYYLSGPDASIL